MIFIWMTMIMFLIVVVIHLFFCRQSESKSRTGLFMFIAFIGLIILWVLFDHFFIHLSKQYLKSTATIMYLLFIPLYLSFYYSVNPTGPSAKILKILKDRSKVGYDELLSGIKEEGFLEQALEELRRTGWVRKKD